MTNSITITATVKAPIDHVWETWTNPEHIKNWNAASDDWHTPTASNDVRVGGEFHFYMEARDKSTGFDFGGTYTKVEDKRLIAYTMEGGRQVEVTFENTPEGIKITETFDPENQNPLEMQRSGWQSILDKYKAYTERKQ